MSNTRGASEPTLRGEVMYLLQHRMPDFERDCALVGTAWTVDAIAEELDAKAEDVQAVLSQLDREGQVTTRRPRSGEWLYKLVDDNHERWQAFSGARLRNLRFAS